MSECSCKAFDSNHSEFQHEARKIVSFKDKGRSEYRYNNQSANYLAKYRVDDGLISNNDPKCDFLLLNCEQKKAFFIELKGSNIVRAIEQITRSMDDLQGNLGGFAVFARIVLTRDNTTKLNIGNKLLKLEQKVKALNGDFIKASRGLLEETI